MSNQPGAPARVGVGRRLPPPNPFELLGLPLGASLSELTLSLRERIEDTESEAEAQQLRELWEALTGPLASRAALVFGAMPTLGQELAAAPALTPVPMPAKTHFDTAPLPDFPLAWDAIASRTKTPSVDLGTDSAFVRLAAVEVP